MTSKSAEIVAEPTPRMRSEDRRELILAAATEVFGERGYVGATTDAVAKAAGVSQPYVVRMFGTKEALFLEVLDRALGRLIRTFETAIATPSDPRLPAESQTLQARIGIAYADLLADRGLLLSLMHAFVLGSDPAIGEAARVGFLQVYRLLREQAGFTAEETENFLAHGMLLNTMVGLRMADEYGVDPCAKELLETAMPHKLDILLQVNEDSRRA